MNNKNSKEKKINIAIIDSGVDAYHPKLFHHINKSKAVSFVENTSPLIDNLGHGTEIAGIITKVASNISLTPYKIVECGKADSLNVIKAIIRAVKNKEDIINLSLGTLKSFNNEEDVKIIKMYQKAIDFAVSNNVIIVSSLGNNNLNLDYQLQNNKLVHLPSYFDKVISVGSVNKNNKLSSFTNYYEFRNFLVAKGGDYLIDNNGEILQNELIPTTFPTYLDSPLVTSKGLSMTTGCSISASIVSGTIANILNKYDIYNNKKLSVNEIKIELSKYTNIKHETFNNHKINYSILSLNNVTN